jgi:hypothetical protein
MSRTQFRSTVIAAVRRLSRSTGQMLHRQALGHAAAGIALSGLFVGVLCGSGSTVGRLLVASENLAVLAQIFVMHAALFACACFATSALVLPTGGRPAAGRARPECWPLRPVTVRG